MTPEQKERLEYLRTKPPACPEPFEKPVHFTHAHFVTPAGKDPCPCPPACNDCGVPEEEK